MFTDIYKIRNTFGPMIGSGSTISDLPHTDEIYEINGSKRYYNKNFPFHVYSVPPVNIYSSSNPFRAYTGTINGVNCHADGTAITGTVVSSKINNDGSVTNRQTFSNTTAAPVEINSIAITMSNAYLWTSSDSGSTSNYTVIAIYVNLNAPITIPANDTIILDVTFSAGDISDVSVG